MRMQRLRGLMFEASPGKVSKTPFQLTVATTTNPNKMKEREREREGGSLGKEFLHLGYLKIEARNH
jgi:hypothetical protein